MLGWDGYDHAWNLVKYTLGSHDDVGDQNNGDAEDGLTNWDRRHRYLVDQLGGRDDWTARAKCRLAWALNVAMPGTPMLFMGSECLQASPHVAWGYWHDGADRNGDHRFDWTIAGDALGMPDAPARRRGERGPLGQPRAARRLAGHHARGPRQPGARLRPARRATTSCWSWSTWATGPSRDHGYGVRTGGRDGRWTQVLCTQDAAFGGWDGAGNAFHEPWTQADGTVYINLPKWSVVVMRRI